MTDYLIFTTERFRHEGADHIKSSNKKYVCHPLNVSQHPYTDENPVRLFAQISEIYEDGDNISTLEKSSITNNGIETLLTDKLSSDEMRMLAISISESLWKKDKK